MRKITDLTGKTYARLTVISYSHTKPGGKVHWVCKCSCGKTTIVRSDQLKDGNTTSCGCRQKETLLLRETHSEAFKGKKTHEYRAYHNMKARCLNKNHKHYHNYGGRGIIICDRWLESYANFLTDVGRAPGDDFSLDRINNDLNYEPGNCKWSTFSEQQNNKRTCRYLTFFGERKTLTQWAKTCGIDPRTLHYRAVNNWPCDRFFLKPNRSTVSNPDLA